VEPDRVYVIYTDRPRTAVREALHRLDPAAGWAPSAVVGLKPNLVVAKPSSSGATTSVPLIEGLVEYLKDRGFRRIQIMESAGVGHSTTRAFKVTGLEAMAARQGVELIDLKAEESTPVTQGSFSTQVFRRALEVDYLINLPVAKAHSQTRITCALKNLKGLIPDSEKRRFHSLGLHRPIAGLNTIIRPHLIVADGLEGDLSFEEGGTPVRMDRIMIARDPVLLDSFVASGLGYRWSEIDHLALAEGLGVGAGLRAADQVVELNHPLAPTAPVIRDRGINRLARRIEARQACSTCYGGLIHALERLRQRGKLERLQGTLHVGQGFKGIEASGLGLGQCAAGFSRSLPGCPPDSRRMVDFLEGIIDGRA